MTAGLCVVIVDDAPPVLRLLTHIVRNVVDCEVASFTDPRAAIEYLHSNSATFVISDFHMPGMDGAKFLAVVQEQYPHVVRMAISGSAGALANMQLAGAAHQFFQKPEDIQKLAKRIERMLELRAMLPSHGIDHLVARIKTLPTPPILFAELESALARPDTSSEEVGRILERDVSMSAKILQLCNSAFFGFREHVTMPHHAVALLGVNLVRSLVLAFHAFEKWTNRVPRFDHNALLAHSLAVASATQDIAEAQGVPAKIKEEFFVAGLLHDIGKLVLAANASETYNNVFEIAARENRPFIEVERDLLGATHAEAGAYLLGLWGFSDGVVMATAYHHFPSTASNLNSLLLAAVHVANAFDHQRAGENRVVDLDYLKSLNLVNRLDTWRALGSDTPTPTSHNA